MADEPRQRHAVALVIGVGAYAHDGVPDLGCAVPDAEAVAELLADPEVCGFPPDGVKLLADGKPDKPDRATVVHHLSNWLPENAAGAELVVIYFAGHGMVRRAGKQEEGYLLPHDADPKKLAVSGVPMSELAKCLDELGDKGVRSVAVFLDCCHAGMALTRGPEDTIGTRDVGLRPSAITKILGKGRFVMAACDDGQRSVEDPVLGHGLFTHHLLDGIEGGGDRDRDQQVGFGELFEYVSRKVTDAAKKLGHEQTPWRSDDTPAGSYISVVPPTPRTRRVGPLSLVASGPPTIERVRQTAGTEAAVAEIAKRMCGADDDTLVQLLTDAGTIADPLAVPHVVPLLKHATERVAEKARRAMQAIGIKETFDAIEELAARNDLAVGPVLDGLGTLEARRDLVEMLSRVVNVLRGNLRQLAIDLHDRKRLSLGLESVSALLRETHSPYTLRRVLGQGLFAAAYEAEHSVSGAKVVVRVLREDLVAQLIARTEFIEVARRAHRAKHHQNLASTLDVRFYERQAVYYTVRAFVDGTTLRDVLTRDGRFDPLKAVDLLADLLRGMAGLHLLGECHGGVKPSNVFVCADGCAILGDLTPVLLPRGFGPDPRLVYNSRYTAPEILRGLPAGPAADLYALGCIAFELFCGRPPFDADNESDLMVAHRTEPVPPVRTLRPGLPPEVDAFLGRLLAKLPASRPDGAVQALAELDVVRDSLRRPPPPTTPPAGEPAPDVPTPHAPVTPARLERFRPAETRMSVGDDRPMTMALPSDDSSVPDERPTQSAAGPRPKGTPGEPIPGIPGYRIIRTLGRGGMGVVYEALDERLSRHVAIKMMHAELGFRTEARRRFEREARAVAQIDHPNVVPILTVGEHAGSLYIVMPLLRGETLSERLARERPLRIWDVLRIAREVAAGLTAAHEQGLIHRDIKPANIWLDADVGRVRILDFGLARGRDEDDVNVTQSGAILGTPAYMSPEQAQGRPVDQRTDLFSLGCMLYEAATGRRAFAGDNAMAILAALLTTRPAPPRAVNPAVPQALSDAIMRLIATDPYRRFATAEEFVRATRNVTPPKSEGKPLEQPRSVAKPPPPKPPPVPPPEPTTAGPPTEAFEPPPDATLPHAIPPEPPRAASLWRRIARWFTGRKE